MPQRPNADFLAKFVGSGGTTHNMVETVCEKDKSGGRKRESIGLEAPASPATYTKIGM
jgi:hypothetical protein